MVKEIYPDREKTPRNQAKMFNP